MDIAVIGAGSWGTALAKVLAERGHAVTLWGRSAEHMAEIAARRENTRYLPGARLPDTLTPESDLGRALADKHHVLSVVPSHTVRAVLTEAAPRLPDDVLLISASKGIENDTLATMDEVIGQILPPRITTPPVFLSGPSFAREVAAGLPTAVVMASRERAAAERAAALFHGDWFRVYTSEDVPGVELGGALKNVMAIAAGVADGLGLGHNSRAALITRGLAEISRLAVRKGANPLTLAGLAGLGDLVLTCTGDLSRNRTVGLGLGRGQAIKQVLASMSQVAEGVRTTRSAHDLAARMGVEMPITDAMYQVIYEDVPAREAVGNLLGRAPKPELG